MASPEIIEIESLLQPIRDDSPTGSDLREDSSAGSDYQAIKTARNQARQAERQSVHDGNDAEAKEFWRQIENLAPKILKSQSKDLEVASWYAEALLRRHGFAGLRDAFKIIEGLVDKFWDNLYPMPDEYGMETRVSCLAGLNGEGAEGVLIVPIRKVPLTSGDEPEPFSLWQYHQVNEINRIGDANAKQAKLSALGFDMDDIHNAVNSSSETFYVNLKADIEACIFTYKHVGQILDEKCGVNDAPSTKNITNILEECLGAIKHIASHKFPTVVETEETTEEVGTDQAAGAVGAPPKVVTKGPIASREDALKQLLEIADYFKKNEPHSPISYVLQKAVKWGNMSLGELIAELIPDSSSRERFSELTGVEPQDQS